tara:strand:+ start:1677 stop:1859 length:183 start_codon:yes stop_codon:yes gene_type:complete
MILNHLTPQEVFLKEVTKSLQKNLELKAEIIEKINSTYGGEKLSWIKKYNGLFIELYTHR